MLVCPAMPHQATAPGMRWRRSAFALLAGAALLLPLLENHNTRHLHSDLGGQVLFSAHTSQPHQPRHLAPAQERAPERCAYCLLQHQMLGGLGSPLSLIAVLSATPELPRRELSLPPSLTPTPASPRGPPAAA